MTNSRSAQLVLQLMAVMSAYQPTSNRSKGNRQALLGLASRLNCSTFFCRSAPHAGVSAAAIIIIHPLIAPPRTFGPIRPRRVVRRADMLIRHGEPRDLRSVQEAGARLGVSSICVHVTLQRLGKYCGRLTNAHGTPVRARYGV